MGATSGRVVGHEVSPFPRRSVRHAVYAPSMLGLLLMVAGIASEAVIGLVATRAAEHGFESLKAAFDRLGEARAAGDEEATEAAEQEIQSVGEARPEEARVLVEDVLGPGPSSTASRITVLEAFLTTVFSMVSQIEPGVVALCGSLCSSDAVTIIDTRTAGKLHVPTPPGPQYPMLVLHDTKDAVNWGIPRMWILMPPIATSQTDVIEKLTAAFGLPLDDLGQPQVISPLDLSSATLAEISGLGMTHLSAIGRVRLITEQEVKLDASSSERSLDTEPDKQASDPLASLRERDREQQIQRDLASAGFTHAFLRHNAAGIAELRASVKRRFDLAVQTNAEAESAQRRIDEELGKLFDDDGEA